jgi:polysaccharide deacetylase family protein (PEP-CTERM system associated)
MNILSFDIEEWFHILDHGATRTEEEWSNFDSRINSNVDRILLILDDNNQKATFFCLGWIGRHYPEVIRRIDAAGHEIASHSDRHQLVYEQTPREFEADLADSLSVLQDLTGRRVNTYRAPGFSVTAENREWVFEKLLEAGIEIDCSVFPASRGHGGMPDFSEERPTLIQCRSGQLREFPINTHPVLGRRVVFSGGGYFRLMPYSLIRRFAKNSAYVMTYFHPRDFDKGQPVIGGLSQWRYFKSYYGLSSCERKLRQFLKDFDFVTVGAADTSIGWESVPTVRI